MSGLDGAISDPVVRACLEESGWRPDYRCDADEWIKWLKSEGFSVHDFGIESLRTLGGLRISPPTSVRSVFHSGVFFVDPQWAATGESQRIREREEKLGGKLCPIGEWMGQYIVLVSDTGRVYAETTFEVLDLGRDLAEALVRMVVADSPPLKLSL